MVLGAEGVSIGTGFALTKESPIHQNTKDLCLKAKETDTLYSDKFDGLYSRVLITERTKMIAERIGFNPLKALKNAIIIKKMLGVPFKKLVPKNLKTSSVIDLARQAESVISIRRGIRDGDEEHGIIPIGQIIGLIDKEITVKELIDSMVEEAKQVLRQAGEKVVE